MCVCVVVVDVMVFCDRGRKYPQDSMTNDYDHGLLPGGTCLMISSH